MFNASGDVLLFERLSQRLVGWSRGQARAMRRSSMVGRGRVQGGILHESLRAPDVLHVVSLSNATQGANDVQQRVSSGIDTR